MKYFCNSFHKVDNLPKSSVKFSYLGHLLPLTISKFFGFSQKMLVRCNSSAVNFMPHPRFWFIPGPIHNSIRKARDILFYCILCSVNLASNS